MSSSNEISHELWIAISKKALLDFLTNNIYKTSLSQCEHEILKQDPGQLSQIPYGQLLQHPFEICLQNFKDKQLTQYNNQNMYGKNGFFNSRRSNKDDLSFSSRSLHLEQQRIHKITYLPDNLFEFPIGLVLTKNLPDSMPFVTLEMYCDHDFDDKWLIGKFATVILSNEKPIWFFDSYMTVMRLMWAQQGRLYFKILEPSEDVQFDFLDFHMTNFNKHRGLADRFFDPNFNKRLPIGRYTTWSISDNLKDKYAAKLALIANQNTMQIPLFEEDFDEICLIEKNIG